MLMPTAVSLLALSLLGAPATPDALSLLLEKGPMARVENDHAGHFDNVLSVVDVDAPADDLWRALTDYDSYRFFMPRVSSVVARPDKPGRMLVDWKIDTPLVATTYTNAVTVDHEQMVMTARTIEGDMVGSRYEWRVVRLTATTCRMFHQAWPRAYAAIVATLDDDQQTLTIGVSVGSVLATTRALQARAMVLAKQRPTHAVPVIEHR